jgi:Tol biopolymer transport system component
MQGNSSRKKMVEIMCPLFLMSVLYLGCKDKGTNPIPSGDYSLCYEKEYNGQWEIFTNNISGTAPQNISNYPGDDEYPQWSPDGRYIVYSRRLPTSVVEVVVYDTKTNTNTMLTNDSVNTGLTPQWTPDGKIFYFSQSSYNVYDSGATYLINPDGSQKKKILDFGATIYFYNDSYNFLYIMNYTQVYKSNVDKTVGAFLFDINQTLSQQGSIIRDFNPVSDELLISPTTANGKREIAAYGVSAKSLNVLLTAEDGYTFFQMKYSKDFAKIVVVEHDSSNDEYLSVLENGEKKRLMKIPASNPHINFSYQPMEFSPDGKYIAFSEQIWHSDQWVSFSTPLFVINTAGGSPYKIEDEAHGPSWNPLQ